MYTNRDEINALFDLKGQVAVVTGGGSGIAQAIAMGYAAMDAKVAILDMSQENMDKTAALFEENGHCVVTKHCDIADAGRVKQVFSEVVAELGPVDISVNSAGITLAKPSIETTAEEFSRIIETNVTGTFNCCKAAAESMIPRKKGKIINIGSIRGSIGVEWGMAAYCSSKGGVHMLTRQLAVEWAKYGICVNCLVPNLTITPISKYIQQNKPRYEFYLSRIPMGHPGYPEDFVSAAIFLAGAGSNYVSGQLLYIDGAAFVG
ncbi:MAG: SDR family oxidoreductase [Desulfatitalea sp.]|nr:SDR family oxidoreductase [Desulfatitalea sp.]NNK02245.1 SDR family oxidoreductase [Desulfatitalea sp.]